MKYNIIISENILNLKKVNIPAASITHFMENKLSTWILNSLIWSWNNYIIVGNSLIKVQFK